MCNSRVSSSSLGAAVAVFLTLIGTTSASGSTQGWKHTRRIQRTPVIQRAPELQASAGTIGPITFDETEFTPDATVDGFSTSTLDGSPIPTLTFHYSVNDSGNPDSTFTGGPGTQMYVEDPGIEGGTANAILRIDFGADISDVQFGFALDCDPGTISPGVSVTAFDAGDNVVATTSADAEDTGFDFPEGQATMSFSSSARAIEVEFNDSCDRFLFDNLEYTSLAVPSLPKPILLGLVALLMLLGAALLRRST